MNSDNDSKEVKPRKIAAGKNLGLGMSSKKGRRSVTTKEFISAGVTKAVICVILAVPLGAFVLGFFENGENFGWDVIRRGEAAIAYSLLITIDALTGIRPWSAFHSSDVNKLENALPYLSTCIYTATPVLYLLLMFLWWRKVSRPQKPAKKLRKRSYLQN